MAGRVPTPVALVTAVVTLTTSAIALPYFGWQAAGWSACLAMVVQIIVTTVLVRQSFKVADVGLGCSLCITAAGNRHRDGDCVALSLSAAVSGANPALVVRRGRIWHCGWYHFRCRCGRFADSIPSGVPAGFARSCKSLSPQRLT